MENYRIDYLNEGLKSAGSPYILGNYTDKRGVKHFGFIDVKNYANNIPLEISPSTGKLNEDEYFYKALKKLADRTTPKDAKNRHDQIHSKQIELFDKTTSQTSRNKGKTIDRIVKTTLIASSSLIILLSSFKITGNAIAESTDVTDFTIFILLTIMIFSFVLFLKNKKRNKKR